MAASTSDTTTFSVSGRTALVTGAGSGINLAFARLLLSKGCNVVIADIGLRPEAKKTIEEYSKQPRAVFIKTDVAIWKDLESAFETADKEFGGADIVCPGAGIFEPHWTNFWHPPGTEKSKDPVLGDNGVGHYACLDINITHPIRMTQQAISRWLNPTPSSKQGKASPSNPKRIVHVSSIAGQGSSFPVPLYTASKHAISGFIRCMGPLDTLGIRVNGVAPGIIRTPLWTDHPEKQQMVAESDTWIEPEEVAEAMLKCVESEEVTGGWVLEVTKNHTRRVTNVNDPGPQGAGASIGNGEVMANEVFQWLAEPGWGVAK